MTPSKRRRQGRQAFPDDDCPYPENSSSAIDWWDGWEEASAEHEAEQQEYSDKQDLVDEVMCVVDDVRSLVEFLVDRNIIQH